MIRNYTYNFLHDNFPPPARLKECFEYAENIKNENYTCLVIPTIFDDKRYVERCKNLAESNRNIFFLNNLPVRSLVELYSLADLFVTWSTSEYETFGRSPLEAMACGVPVVVPIYKLR